MRFPPFGADEKQLHENEPIGGILYVSAFSPSCHIVRHNKVGQRNRGSKRKLVHVKRPIETILLLLIGVSLILGLTLMAVASNLLIKLTNDI
jgi:hypothetical protein